MKCETCGDRTSERFCSFCNKLYFKEEKIRTRQKQEEEIVVNKETIPLCERECQCCKKGYKPRSHKQKFCSDECRPKPLTPAEKWLNAKPREYKGLDSNQISYGFFRKKYGVSNRFNACRG